MFLSWGYHNVLYFVLCIAMIRERVLSLEDTSIEKVPTKNASAILS
jgi:hypothetical protein